VTPHAVERYIARVRTGIEYRRALGELISMSERAHFVKTRRDGYELWRGPPPRRLRFVVGSNMPGKPQLLTVLFAFDREREDGLDGAT
jgi:hypothetical protein